MKKSAQLIMIPTNEKANVGSIVTRPSDNRMAIVNVLTKDDPQPCIHQHLYILSDKEIEEGDWFYDLDTKYIKIKQSWENSHLDFNCKKIIASTNRSLNTFIESKDGNYTEHGQGYFKELPQPPQSFIEHFVSEYNKGNVITEVMVEYKSIGAYANPKYDSDYQLKINSDNTINISMPKDSWSREEVKQLFDKWNDIVYKGYYVAKKDLETVLDYSDKWIEENL